MTVEDRVHDGFEQGMAKRQQRRSWPTGDVHEVFIEGDPLVPALQLLP